MIKYTNIMFIIIININNNEDIDWDRSAPNFFLTTTHLNELPNNQRRLKNLDGDVSYRYSIAIIIISNY